MFSWLSSDKKRAQQKAERDARLRAELAIKAQQFDAENGHLFGESTEITKVDEPETKQEKRKSSTNITIHDISSRTFFNI